MKPWPVAVSVTVAVAAVLMSGSGCSRKTKPRVGKPNVLFIVVDDLRPQLGAYGAPVNSPNIDSIVSHGTLFMRAYCQQAVCNPSRSSLMTGRRPESTGVFDMQESFRTKIPDVVTLPQYFKENGYQTIGLGKVYQAKFDDEKSWSVPSWSPGAPDYFTREDVMLVDAERKRKGGYVFGPSWEAADVPDGALRDGQTAERAIQTLRQVKDQPFFLALGISKPHLPFVVPRKYFDQYPLDRIQLAPNPSPPAGVPEIALNNFWELRQFSDINKTGPISDAKARELIRGYRASTSYIDAQIGRVVAELDRLGLRDNTIIVVWGDHGFHLGEHGLWGKHTNFEINARAPLIISAPGQTRPGAKTNGLVEFVDVFPTLCELAGLPPLPELEGVSAVPLMKAPEQPWKKAAFTEIHRGPIAGYSMRTERYRYCEWQNPGQASARELYDHEADPDENVNLAEHPDQAERVKELSAQLHAGWRAALPAKP